MSRATVNKGRNALILKEQKQLFIIQKELEEILHKINDSINVLKVEELQLKSSAVVFENPSCSEIKIEKTTTAPLKITPVVSSLDLLSSSTTFPDWTQQSCAMETSINTQKVDLDIKAFSCARQDIEEEDE